jgi:hypothetical protein
MFSTIKNMLTIPSVQESIPILTMPMMENDNDSRSPPSPIPNNHVGVSFFEMMKSTGSLMGSSIRSNQVSCFDDREENASITSWRIGMPWLLQINSNITSNNFGSPRGKKQHPHRLFGLHNKKKRPYTFEIVNRHTHTQVIILQFQESY